MPGRRGILRRGPWQGDPRSRTPRHPAAHGPTRHGRSSAPGPGARVPPAVLQAPWRGHGEGGMGRQLARRGSWPLRRPGRWAVEEGAREPRSGRASATREAQGPGHHPGGIIPGVLVPGMCPGARWWACSGAPGGSAGSGTDWPVGRGRLRGGA